MPNNADSRHRGTPRQNPGNAPAGPGHNARKNDRRYDTAEFALFRDNADSAPKRENTPPQKNTSARRPAQKRQSSSRARRRRHQRFLAVLLVIVLLLGGVVWTGTVLLKINDFSLVGECIYSLEELRAVFGHETGESMYSFGAGAEARRMEQELPYLEKLVIRRRLPGTVEFVVTPALESYCIQYGGEYAVLSAAQKVLRVTPDAPADLVLITGLGEAQVQPGYPLLLQDTDRGVVLTMLLEALAVAPLGYITRIDAENTAALYFVWENRITVLMGGRQNLEKKTDFVLVLLTDPDERYITSAMRGTLDASRYPEESSVLFSPE